MLPSSIRPICSKVAFPNVTASHPPSSRDPSCPPDRFPKGANHMSKPESGAATATKVPSLVDLDRSLESAEALSPVRRRDLRSAVHRVTVLIGEAPAHIPLDMAHIAARLAAVNPVAAGISAKTLANIRSHFLAAVRESGLQPVLPSRRAELSPDWERLFAEASAKRYRLGLARVARYASGAGIAPAGVDDLVLEQLIDEVRRGSLHQKPNVLHRQLAVTWNSLVAAFPQFGVRAVTKPCFRAPPKRVEWDSLTEAFRADVEDYLEWCRGTDPFADNARPRPLKPRTLKLRRNQIHAAVSAFLASDVSAAAVTSLGDLVTEAHFRKILRRRHAETSGKPNNFNRDLAETLVQIAREWVKVDSDLLQKLKTMTAKMPMPKKGLTNKNNTAMRQFDDPAVVRRLLDLPDELWREVKRDAKPNFRTLARAQAALAIAILTYMPLRSDNLHKLEFDRHIFLRGSARATSSLEIAAEEVKNGETGIAYDIPLPIAKKLIEYRERIAPVIIGHRPNRLFVKPDGTLKSQAMVAHLIKTYLRKRAGIIMTPHQFRHLSAKIMLRHQPGCYESVRQNLGHKNLKTTNWFYAGDDTRAAGLRHQQSVEGAAGRLPSRTSRKKPS